MPARPRQWSTQARGFWSPARRFSAEKSGRRQGKRSVPLFRPEWHEERRQLETDSIRPDRGGGGIRRRVQARQSTGALVAARGAGRPRAAQAQQGPGLPARRGAVREEEVGTGPHLLPAPVRTLSE